MNSQHSFVTTLLLMLLISLSSTSFANQENPTTEKQKEWQYEDRDNWLAILSSQLDIDGDSVSVIKLSQTSSANNIIGNRIYLIFNENAEPNNGDAMLVKGLTNTGDVWFFDTPDALFIERTRNTLRGLDGRFIEQVVNLASEQYDEIVVVTFDAMSVPVLRGLRRWQETADKASLSRFKNLVLLYPSLYINAPVAGEIPEIFPIAYNSALPITILQPEQGSQANTIGMTERAFKMGGSLVDIESVPIATDGYYKFQDIKLMAKDAIQRIPTVTNRKINLVNKINYQIAQLSPVDYEIPESQIIAGLVKIDEPTTMQPISLASLEGQQIKVPENYQGKALLVNFWATWCPHCVEEIPSMNRALEALDAERFAMISISYKDTKEIMSAFVKEVQVDFPILMDYDGAVSKEWNVFAYPSSFLIDANGKIQYSINAGAIWDAPEMLQKLREVMEIPAKK